MSYNKINLTEPVKDLFTKKGIRVERLYRLSRLSEEQQRQLTAWSGDGTQVKVLAHAYLPILYSSSPNAILKELLKADLIIIDESPFPRFLTSSTMAGRHQQIYLETFLEALAAHGYLTRTRTPGEIKEMLWEQVKASRNTFMMSQNRRASYLAGQDLYQALQPYLETGRAPIESVVRTLQKSWKKSFEGSGTDTSELDWKALLITKAKLLKHQLARLLGGEADHHLTLLVAGNSAPLIRGTVWQQPSLPEQVLYLDAYPHPILHQHWLGEARTFRLGRVREKVHLNCLESPSQHDRLLVPRLNVTEYTKRGRYRALALRCLPSLGNKVLILSHQSFNRATQEQFQKARKNTKQTLRFMHWNAGRGFTAYAGHDVLILNEARLPQEFVALDLACLNLPLRDRQDIRDYLQVTDFLQVIHRVRPLLQHKDQKAGTQQCLCAFDPFTVYGCKEDAEPGVAGQLLQRTLSVTPTLTGPIRTKSEHTEFLELARIAMDQAFDRWQACPERLIHLLRVVEENGKLPETLSPEPWDSALLELILELQADDERFAQLSLTPRPTDLRERGISRLFAEYDQYLRERPRKADHPIGLKWVGWSWTTPGRRGRPPSSNIWFRVKVESAPVGDRAKKLVKKLMQD